MAIFREWKLIFCACVMSYLRSRLANFDAPYFTWQPFRTWMSHSTAFLAGINFLFRNSVRRRPLQRFHEKNVHLVRKNFKNFTLHFAMTIFIIVSLMYGLCRHLHFQLITKIIYFDEICWPPTHCQKHVLFVYIEIEERKKLAKSMLWENVSRHNISPNFMVGVRAEWRFCNFYLIIAEEKGKRLLFLFIFCFFFSSFQFNFIILHVH